MSAVLNDPCLPDRFWSKVREVESGCWEWTASINRHGYGQFGRATPIGWRMRSAHRVSYLEMIGPIPEGLDLDHLCRVRHCVNPDHLEPVTRAENIRRGESPSARWGRRTHCGQGHLFDEANTRITRAGHRRCRACHRINQRARWLKSKGVQA